MKIERTPFYFCPKFEFKLRIPLIRKIVEQTNAMASTTVWISHDLMKQTAVTGRKEAKLYPYMHINLVKNDLRPPLRPFLRIS